MCEAQEQMPTPVPKAMGVPNSAFDEGHKTGLRHLSAFLRYSRTRETECGIIREKVCWRERRREEGMGAALERLVAGLGNS